MAATRPGWREAGRGDRTGGDRARRDVTWFEEPVSSQDLVGLAAIRRQVRPDVAAGEYSWSLADSAALITAGAVDCLQLDVTRCGGITASGATGADHRAWADAAGTGFGSGRERWRPV